MVFQKPVVEFVPIDLAHSIIRTSGCPEYITQDPAGGGQRCIASQVDAQDCVDWVNDTPWLD